MFIGAGYIAMEFASIARAAGSEVTIVEYSDHALSGFDSEYSQEVVRDMINKGIKFDFNQRVSQVISTENNQYILETAQGKKYTTEYVMDTTGRIPNIANLGLDAANVEYNNHGVVVNDYLQTSNVNIYASGDVIDKLIPRLTPTATFESNYIARILLGDSNPIKYPVVPSVAFTLPRLAQVGVTVGMAKNDQQLKIYEIPYGKLMRFQTLNDENAKIKIILNKDKRLVGASIIGDFAPEIINDLVQVINHQYTSEDIQNQIFAFPTHSGILLPMIAQYLA